MQLSSILDSYIFSAEKLLADDSSAFFKCDVYFPWGCSDFSTSCESIWFMGSTSQLKRIAKVDSLCVEHNNLPFFSTATDNSNIGVMVAGPDEFNEWGAFEESQPTLVSLEAPRSEMEESMSIFEGFESVPAVPVQANGGGKSESPVEAPAAPLSTPVADVASGAEADKLPPPEFNDWGVSVEELLPVPMSSEAPKSVMEESMFEGSETVPVVPAEVSRRAHPYRLFSQSAKAGKSGGKSMKARKCTFFC